MKNIPHFLLISIVFLLVYCQNEQPIEYDKTPLFRIIKDGYYGFIDSTGKVVIPPKLANAGQFLKA
jgi:hypothetical protein